MLLLTIASFAAFVDLLAQPDDPLDVLRQDILLERRNTTTAREVVESRLGEIEAEVKSLRDSLAASQRSVVTRTAPRTAP